MAADAQAFCAKLEGIPVNAGAFEQARLQGAFSTWTNAQRREYADLVLLETRRGHAGISIAPALSAMSRVYLAWLLRTAEGPC